MKPHVIAIGNWQLALAMVFVLTAGVSSLIYKLKLEKDLLIGSIRTFAQLFLMGYVLTIIFRLRIPWLVIGVFAMMIGFAAWTIHGRVKERQVSFFVPTLITMMATYMLVTLLVSGCIVEARPWWEPQYFIPLGGMVVGNSMNAIAISLERLFSELRKRREQVEMMLCLGADYREASQAMLVDAMKAGMIPSINSMMGVGLVFLPGMMTGQILAGAEPLTAIRYQIVVMLMLVGSTAVGSLLVTLLVRRLCFGSAQQLKLQRS